MADPIRRGHNGLDSEKIEGFVKRVDNLEAELASAKGEYMRRCQTLREDIKAVLEEASDDGVPKKAFKAYLKQRDLLRRADGVRDDLEADDAETLDQIRHALGELEDTPLGQAAIARTGAVGEIAARAS